MVRTSILAATALVVAVGIAGCDRAPPTPRSDAAGVNAPGPVTGGATDASRTRDAPGPIVGATPSPSRPPAAPTAAPSETGAHAAVDAQPGSVGPNGSAAAPGTGGGSTTESGSLTADQKNAAMPMPKQNNDHSVPATVRAPIGEAGSVAALPYGQPGSGESATPDRAGVR
jgi:hypothetical protein